MRHYAEMQAGASRNDQEQTRTRPSKSMRGVFASGDDIGVKLSAFQADQRPGCDALRERRIRTIVISPNKSRYDRDTPECALQSRDHR